MYVLEGKLSMIDVRQSHISNSLFKLQQCSKSTPTQNHIFIVLDYWSTMQSTHRNNHILKVLTIGERCTH